MIKIVLISTNKIYAQVATHDIQEPYTKSPSNENREL